MLSAPKSKPKAARSAVLPTESELIRPAAPERGDIALDLGRLRAALHPEPARGAAIVEDGALAAGATLTAASVLFPIILHPQNLTVMLTERTAHLRDHPGQVSFPGGRAEAHDPSPAHTALREAEEEVGLHARHIEIAGYLPEYRTSTGFKVTPVVAFVTPPFELRPDPFEVAEVFEVPLSFLLDPANHDRHSRQFQGQLRHYYAMSYDGHMIWGATAGMIVSLYRALGAGA